MGESMTRRKLAFAGALAFAMATAHASLIDRGGGLIYDDALNITWLKDANYAKTSGYDADGLMNWSEATFWATRVLNYGGYRDWRLPTADENCYGFWCASPSSEMGYLFYFHLGVPAGHNILTSSSPDLALFSNVQPSIYWTGTAYVQSPNVLAWSFDTNGIQRYEYQRYNEFYAWAVRPGDVVSLATPEPAALTLSLVALLGIGFSRLKNKSF